MGEQLKIQTGKTRKGEKTMKKILSILLALAMIVCASFAFTACGDGDDGDDGETPAPAGAIKIGVQAGTTGEYFVNGDADWGFDGIAGYEAKGYANGGLAVTDMLNGNVKYVVIDQQPALQLAQKISGIKVLNIPLTEEEYAFGVDKAQPELLNSINAIVAAMKTDGKLNEIVAKYATGVGITPVTSATLDLNRKSEQLVVATNANFAPFEYKEGANFLGIDMEIAAYIAAQLNLELVIVDMDFDAVVTSVGTNGIDVAMAGLTVNDVRKQSVNFTESYYDAAQVIIVKQTETAFNLCESAEDVIAKLESLAG